jgi:uncharacterized protein YbjT (DUF2867 family)
MKNILILGGTGFVGRHVCEKIQREGWRCTVPTRRSVNASAVQHLPRLTVVEANVHDEAQLLRLLPGHDAVVNLVAILHGNEAAFERVHVTLPATLARACQATGVRRIVHVSALGAALDAPSVYQRSKARGEAVLSRDDLLLSILRPSVIFGAGDRFLNLFAQLQALIPVMPLACAHARFQPVWVEDVARAVLACLRDTGLPHSSVGQTFECTGPEVFTLADLVRMAGRLGSHQRPILPLPLTLSRLQAMAMELAPGEPMMSRDNLASMSVDNVASGRYPDMTALGFSTTSLNAVAPGYLGRRGRRSHLDVLRRNLGT